MKKYIYFLLALCISAVVCSCSKKEDEEQGQPGDETGKTEFIMMGGYEVASGLAEEAVEEQSAIILKAFQNVGFNDKLELILVAEDSAAVSKLLAEKMKLVMSELEASPVRIKATILVKGVEKKFLGAENDKTHPVSLFYQKNIGIVRGDNISWKYLGSHVCDARWVYNIRSEEFLLPKSPDDSYYSVFIDGDTNKGVGGDYVYVIFEFTGYSDYGPGKEDINSEYLKQINHFVWEDAYADKYITDVICIYGGGEPQEITIDGRRYHKANRVADLNKKAGGEYVYLYTTTDPVKGYEGYYLNTGISQAAHGKCCRMLYCDSHFWAKDHMNAPFVAEGHRFVERVVQAYWTNGTYAEEMNTNKGHGNNVTRCRMILTYATKNGGY